jgi:predicted negative regulator of RcsB-dependent stress response
MTLGQIAGLVLTIVVFFGLVGYRTWQDRQEERRGKATRPAGAEPRRAR